MLIEGKEILLFIFKLSLAFIITFEFMAIEVYIQQESIEDNTFSTSVDKGVVNIIDLGLRAGGLDKILLNKYSFLQSTKMKRTV